MKQLWLMPRYLSKIEQSRESFGRWKRQDELGTEISGNKSPYLRSDCTRSETKHQKRPERASVQITADNLIRLHRRKVRSIRTMRTQRPPELGLSHTNRRDGCGWNRLMKAWRRPLQESFVSGRRLIDYRLPVGHLFDNYSCFFFLRPISQVSRDPGGDK